MLTHKLNERNVLSDLAKAASHWCLDVAVKSRARKIVKISQKVPKIEKRIRSRRHHPLHEKWLYVRLYKLDADWSHQLASLLLVYHIRRIVDERQTSVAAFFAAY